jgi:hypothetical protein
MVDPASGVKPESNKRRGGKECYHSADDNVRLKGPPGVRGDLP